MRRIVEHRKIGLTRHFQIQQPFRFSVVPAHFTEKVLLRGFGSNPLTNCRLHLRFHLENRWLEWPEVTDPGCLALRARACFSYFV
ncbi:MAG: hypothetical protein R3E02_04090 [Blastomonas sp.]